MKKIGFVDLYISEWHANNYPAWISEITSEYKVAYAFAEVDVSPVTGETTDEWCQRCAAEKCESIDELCAKCDCIVILAPSNPEVHLKYAEAVLKHGKPTYIDKTFAPDRATADKIYDIARRYNTPMFSTSALRYADEYRDTVGYRRIITTGGGSNAPEYIIHQAETVVKHLGAGATSVSCVKKGDELIFNVAYPDDRCATMIYGEAYGFTTYLSGKDKAPRFLTAGGAFFKELMKDIIRFFNEGTPSFSALETLEVASIREGAVKAMENVGKEVKI